MSTFLAARLPFPRRTLWLLLLSMMAMCVGVQAQSSVVSYSPPMCTGSSSPCFEPASGVYQVLVEDANHVITPVPAYLNDRGGVSSKYYHFAHFAFSGTVNVHVLVPETTVTSATISPQAFGIPFTKQTYTYNGTTYGEVLFSLAQSRYLIVKIDTHNELVLAADPPEVSAQGASGTGIFNVTGAKYMALTNGSAESTAAFTAAIADASSYGTQSGKPGVVYVPDGIYVTAPLVLQSNVELYLSGNAVLQASLNRQDYPASTLQYHNGGSNYGVAKPPADPSTPTPTTCSGGCDEDGVWFLSTATSSTGISIQGRGVVDGNGSALTGASSTNPAPTNANALLDVLIMPVGTSHFTVDGIVGWDAGGWSFTPTRSSNVVIQNYKAMQSLSTYQDDGFDIQESQEVSLNHVIAVSRDDSYTTKTWHEYEPPTTSGSKTLCNNSLGVGSCWPGQPQELADVSFIDVVSWTTDGGFKVGEGNYQNQYNISVDGLYIYKSGYALYLKPDENSSDVGETSYVRVSHAYAENCTRWLDFDSIGVRISNVTLSNVQVNCPSTTTSYTEPAGASTTYLQRISFQGVNVNGTVLQSSADFTGDLANKPLTGETFVAYDSGNPILASAYRAATPAQSNDIVVQQTIDKSLGTPAELTDVRLAGANDTLQYKTINFGLSSASITLRVNPSAPGVTLNLYADSTSTPVGSWTSQTVGWQTIPITFTQAGIAQPLTGKHTLLLSMGNGGGQVNVAWLQPAQVRLDAASATVGSATKSSCAACESGSDVTNFVSGSTLQFASHNFGAVNGPATSVIDIRLAASEFRQGALQFYLDTMNSAPIGTLSVPSTGGWNSWQTFPVPVTPTTGNHTLYVVASCSNSIKTSKLTDADDQDVAPLSNYPTCFGNSLAIANIDVLSF